MDVPDRAEHRTQSFVVRIWIEEPAKPDRGATWRGHITHVQSGARRSIDSVVDILRFIVVHLEAVGIRRSVVDKIRLAVLRVWHR